MLTFARLLEVLSYNPLTGEWTWIRSVGRKIKAGTVAGCRDDEGYVIIQIDRKQYKAHRLAWLYMTGRWPDPEVDHRDRDTGNNRWENLREATRSQNKGNRRVAASKTGLKGVHMPKGRDKFRATICINGIKKSLGNHDCPAAAHFAYLIAADKHFGVFARAF